MAFFVLYTLLQSLNSQGKLRPAEGEKSVLSIPRQPFSFSDVLVNYDKHYYSNHFLSKILASFFENLCFSKILLKFYIILAMFDLNTF